MRGRVWALHGVVHGASGSGVLRSLQLPACSHQAHRSLVLADIGACNVRLPSVALARRDAAAGRDPAIHGRVHGASVNAVPRCARRSAGRQATRSWESPQGAASADEALRRAVRADPSTQQAWREANGGPGPSPAPMHISYAPGGYGPGGYAPGAGVGPGFMANPSGFASSQGASRSASRSSSGAVHAGGSPNRQGSGGLAADAGGRAGSGFSGGRSGSGFSGGLLGRGSGAGACPVRAPAACAASRPVSAGRPCRVHSPCRDMPPP